MSFVLDRTIETRVQVMLSDLQISVVIEKLDTKNFVVLWNIVLYMLKYTCILRYIKITV